MSREELLDEGRHWFDVTLAQGVESGRYRLVADPQDPSKTRMVAGPNFHTLPPASWMARKIDQEIEG